MDNTLKILTDTEYLSGGIKISSIDNLDTVLDKIKYVTCPVCLNIAYNPLQCIDCDTVICKGCLEILSFAYKKCFGKCKGNYKKPNKYMRETLSACRVNCEGCDKTFFPKDLILHNCLIKNEIKIRDKLLFDIKEKDLRIIEIESEIKRMRSKLNDFNKFNSNRFLDLPADKLREALMTFSLSSHQKIELYTACSEGKLEEFMDLIANKKYPILEEISSKGYYWSSLHYAMNFGQIEIIIYILNYFEKENLLNACFRILSIDNRCPFLCLLQSNQIESLQKEKILDKILSKYNIIISKEVEKEIIARELLHIVKKNKKF